MGKTKKKRTKKYQGWDAKSAPSAVTRVQAADRSRLRQWLYDRRLILKYVGRALLIGAFVIVIVLGIFSLFTR